jgi:hypothetical protein
MAEDSLGFSPYPSNSSIVVIIPVPFSQNAEISWLGLKAMHVSEISGVVFQLY